MDILPYDPHNQISFLRQISGTSQAVYVATVCMVVFGICLLPFISVEIAVNASGIIRPINERANIRSPISALIDTVLVHEGDRVTKHQLLFRLKDSTIYQNQLRLAGRSHELNAKIYDLALLLKKKHPEIAHIPVKTQVYQHDLTAFQSQVYREKLRLTKLDRDLSIAQQLSKQKVIAPQELFDKQNTFDTHVASVRNLIDAQKAKWSDDLTRYQDALTELNSESNLLTEHQNRLLVHSPVAGVVQNLQGLYAEDFITAGQPICTITPDTSLIIETFIPSAEIGLLAKGQACIIRAEAFNHSYFGFLTGEVATIDQDYTLIEGKACFKIRTRMNSHKLPSKGDFVPELKKGMGVQLRFLVTERTLWQLLYDSIDDWLPKNDTNSAP